MSGHSDDYDATRCTDADCSRSGRACPYPNDGCPASNPFPSAENDAPLSEYAEAWIWTPKDGAYPLGPMRDGLGWVSEDNVCRGASNSDHIYFLQWKRKVAR